MKNASAQALLETCKELEGILAQERAAARSGLKEDLILKKEKALEKLKGLVDKGGRATWEEKDLRAVLGAAQKVYSGALASARFADFRSRLGAKLARALGQKAPSTTYNRDGAREKGTDARPRINRTF